jgi:hypothetical protein
MCQFILRKNITLESILLDLNGNCKISNLEFRNEIDKPDKLYHMRQIRRKDLGTLGYVIYQMLTGMILTIDKSLQRILRITPGQDNKLNISEQNISDDAKELLTELIQKLARDIEIINSKEITQAIKKMSFLNKIDWDKLEKGELESMFKPDNVSYYVFFFISIL